VILAWHAVGLHDLGFALRLQRWTFTESTRLPILLPSLDLNASDIDLLLSSGMGVWYSHPLSDKLRCHRYGSREDREEAVNLVKRCVHETAS
jgi:hypothetical protein